MKFYLLLYCCELETATWAFWLLYFFFIYVLTVDYNGKKGFYGPSCVEGHNLYTLYLFFLTFGKPKPMENLGKRYLLKLPITLYNIYLIYIITNNGLG